MPEAASNLRVLIDGPYFFSVRKEPVDIGALPLTVDIAGTALLRFLMLPLLTSLFIPDLLIFGLIPGMEGISAELAETAPAVPFILLGMTVLSMAIAGVFFIGFGRKRLYVMDGTAVAGWEKDLLGERQWTEPQSHFKGVRSRAYTPGRRGRTHIVELVHPDPAATAVLWAFSTPEAAHQTAERLATRLGLPALSGG